MRTSKKGEFKQMIESDIKIKQYIDDKVNHVINYKIPETFSKFGIECLNILIFGPKSSGKSSVINSIKTAFEKKYVHIPSK